MNPQSRQPKFEACSICRKAYATGDSWASLGIGFSGATLTYWCTRCKKWICRDCSKKVKLANDWERSFADELHCPTCDTRLLPYYGADGLLKTKGGCFIATAAFGTESALQIDVLREFRDDVIRSSRLGTVLISSYERFSPPIAEYIRTKPLARLTIRLFIVAPVVALAGLLKRIRLRRAGI